MIARRTLEDLNAFISSRMRETGLISRSFGDDVGVRTSQSISELLSVPYDAVYDLYDNMFPSKAKGEYLIRYQEMLGVDPTTALAVREMSLNNIYIAFTNDAVARDMTANAGMIRFPAGLRIHSTTGDIVGVIINSPIMHPNTSRAFCQVMFEGSSAIQEASVTEIDYRVTEVPNIDPNKTVGIDFKVVQQRAIESRSNVLSENDRRYLLTLASLGLKGGNKAALDAALLRIPGVVRTRIKEYAHGNGSLVIFVEPTDLTFPEPVVEQVKIAAKKVISEGVRVVVQTPKLVYVTMTIGDIGNRDESSVYSTILDLVNNKPAGQGVSKEEINRLGVGKVKKLFRNGKEAITSIPVRDVEKLIMNTEYSIIFS